jgi:PKD domain containing protein
VGEFIEADGKIQQGIVRYPKRAGQPTLPPEGKAETLAAKAEATASGSVDVSFTATWDRDDPTLTYSLYRDDETTPVATEKINDTRWALGSHTLKDIGSPSGEHTYRLVVSDPSGNTITAQTPNVTVSKAFDRNADQAGGVRGGQG